MSKDGYTSHGHEIPGAAVYPPERPPVARCGGPGLCEVCNRESVDWQEERTDISCRYEPVLREIRNILSSAPECDKYSDDDTISCGWKKDMIEVRRILDESGL